jgi:WD40 repeat protein
MMRGLKVRVGSGLTAVGLVAWMCVLPYPLTLEALHTALPSQVQGAANLGSDEATPRLQVQVEHTGMIRAIAVYERVFATAGHDGTARVWDLQSGQLLRVLIGHGSQINSVAFSSDGEKLATCSGISGRKDKSVRIWSLASGTELRRLEFRTAVNSAAFSPDGRTILVGTAGGDATLWSLESGVNMWSFNPAEGKGLVLSDGGIRSVAFSHDGRLALTSGPKLRVWSTAQLTWRGEQLSDEHLWEAVFTRNTATPVRAATSPDVKLAVSADGAVYARSTKKLYRGVQSRDERHSFEAARRGAVPASHCVIRRGDMAGDD